MREFHKCTGTSASSARTAFFPMAASSMSFRMSGEAVALMVAADAAEVDDPMVEVSDKETVLDSSDPGSSGK